MVSSVAPFVALRAHSRVWSITLWLLDIIVIVIGMTIANHIHPLPFSVFVATIILLPFLLSLTGTYRRSFSGSVRDEWYAIGAALSFEIIPLLILSFMLPALWYARAGIVIFATIAFLGFASIRTFAHYSRQPHRVVFVGVPERMDKVLTLFKLHPGDVLLRVPVKTIDDSSEKELPQWMCGAFSWGATHIIVTEALPPTQLLHLTEIANSRGVAISIAPSQLHLHSYKMSLRHEGELPLLHVRQLPILTTAAQIYKRIFDIVLSSIAILILLPIFIVCAIAVKIETPGPIIYRQERIGKDKKPFNIWKFRSMPVNSEDKTGPMWANHKINRPTRVGQLLRRTSMDELPQFFNVLRGDMSLVGPRPERAFFIERFRTTISRYEDRLLVAPGITGWSQIGMSRMLTTDKMSLRLDGDLFYLQEWSPLLDVQILIKTFFEFMFHWQPMK